jgi:rRNA small subunit pseudouridine methyltransferase Nep1
MLSLLLVDSEIELVPQKIASHTAVRLNARRRKKEASRMLLDATLHHTAMRNLPQAKRRGRPDIIHFFLITALESVLNHKGMLRTYIHTRNDELITVDPSTRLPKNYPRFVGLMESLFIDEAVPLKGQPLLRLSKGYSFERCLEEIPHRRVAAFSQEGKKVGLRGYFRGSEEDILCLIGGFSKGDFNSDVRSRSDDIISIYDEPLTVWTVASEIIVNYENAIDG